MQKIHLIRLKREWLFSEVLEIASMERMELLSEEQEIEVMLKIQFLSEGILILLIVNSFMILL